ncbi:lysoplasmalogenase [Flavobacterium caseinilyticum]|uniref:Lysoplasmalogenase n=1 Tax=Flavobacterium caseinilyticum TaxID=2541732 RepID=A0A4R5AYQ8_9FLAO|nr:lysoplasmalogenase [Flavobacterium caseinilyticum]TDD77330.1 lysoplasmalogenase [Flavobacterium caseinilyticum]
MKSTSLLIPFIGFSLLYLLLIVLGREDIAWFFKPLLMPFLILAVYFHHRFTTKKILLTALVLSWIGDILLMFVDKAEWYFTAGLIAFLISHIFYIILFSKQLKIYLKKSKIIFWVGVTVIVCYLTITMLLLLPTLNELTIPVFIYSMTISIMWLFAFKGFLNWQKPANSYILIGSLFFVFSDTILAFNKFYTPLQYSSLLIMSTYLAAQYFIVTGILKLNEKK